MEYNWQTYIMEYKIAAAQQTSIAKLPAFFSKILKSGACSKG